MRALTTVLAVCVAGLLATLTGCGADPTSQLVGQSQPIPVIEDDSLQPQLAESNSNCAVWACSLANVPYGYDPVTQGAFCMAITEEGLPGTPKPSSCEPDYQANCSIWVGENCSGGGGTWVCEGVHTEPC